MCGFNPRFLAPPATQGSKTSSLSQGQQAQTAAETTPAQRVVESQAATAPQPAPAAASVYRGPRGLHV